MMSEARRTIWNDELSLQEKKDILDFIDSLTDEEMKRGYGAMKKNGFIYRFNFAPSREKHLDNLNSGGDFEIIHKVDVSELDEETQNALLKEANGESKSDLRFNSFVRGVRNRAANASGNIEDIINREGTENSVGLSDATASDVATETTDNGGEVGEEAGGRNGEITIKTGWDGCNHPRYLTITEEELRKLQDGLDSHVQLMDGSDGTVYGWCEIERDAEGNVVARHIYLNDEVLNANTMVHEMGQMKDII